MGEAGIVEIHSMFIDLSNMVAMQGEMVDRIEDHINSAVIDVERGRDDLAKAEENKKSANKKKFILGGILALLILIILLVILSEFGAFSGSSGVETVVRHEYVYILPDGTQVVSDHVRPDLQVQPEIALPPTTTTTTTTPAPSPTTSPTPSSVDYDSGPGR